MKNLVIGIVLIIIALGLLFYDGYGISNYFLQNTINLILGGIPLGVVFIGLIFLLIGWDELSVPKIEEFEEKEEKPKEKAKKRKR